MGLKIDESVQRTPPRISSHSWVTRRQLVSIIIEGNGMEFGKRIQDGFLNVPNFEFQTC